MKELLLWVSALAILSEAFAQTDLSGKVFVFPRESSSDHVKLIPKLKKPLQNFTLCFRAYSDLYRAYSLFSYSIQDNDNELLILKEEVGKYILHIGRTKVTFKVMDNFLSPVHICTSWESSTGIAEFWFNGKPMVRKGLGQGYSVGVQPKIVLGQEQDSYGGEFDKRQSFVGEIWDLYMWDSVLSAKNMMLVYQGYDLNPNILDWRDLNYEVQGYVAIKPLVWGLSLESAEHLEIK
ncbi:serum amyloid P-component [Pteronotus mesoamericanus]|uniref:serum amyloid P-component n=1 Tax=Pteronotus mesoamericanus TaxID=1884717 RepID=UPI0023ED5921|nr:serum amyloid P-component [Pteronotus parnellii mesoamericanus]